MDIPDARSANYKYLVLVGMPILLLFLGQAIKHLSIILCHRPGQSPNVGKSNLFSHDVLNTYQSCVHLIGIINDALVEVLRAMCTKMVSFDMSGAIKAARAVVRYE